MYSYMVKKTLAGGPGAWAGGTASRQINFCNFYENHYVRIHFKKYLTHDSRQFTIFKEYYRFLGTVATLGSFLFHFFLTSRHQRRHQRLATTASGLNGDNGRVDVVALAVGRRDESGRRKAQRERLERGGGRGDTVGGGWTT